MPVNHRHVTRRSVFGWFKLLEKKQGHTHVAVLAHDEDDGHSHDASADHSHSHDASADHTHSHGGGDDEDVCPLQNRKLSSVHLDMLSEDDAMLANFDSQGSQPYSAADFNMLKVLGQGGFGKVMG